MDSSVTHPASAALIKAGFYVNIYYPYPTTEEEDMGDVDKSTLFGYINAQIAGLDLQSGQSVELRVDSMLQGIDVTIILTPRQNEVKRTVKENNVSMENVVTHFQALLHEREINPGESIQLKVTGFVGCDVEIIATARGERPQTP